jgi:hypothetical protein
MLAAALAGIAVLATACGGGSAPAVAGDTAYQKALAYSQCMRVHDRTGQPLAGSVILSVPPRVVLAADQC